MERTLTDRLLDAAHDYLPNRAQAWIEERAFNKQVAETVAQREEPQLGAKTWLDAYTESARSAGPEAVAQRLHLSNLGEQWVRDLAKDQQQPTYVLQSGFARDYDAGLRGVPNGQRELFSDRVTPIQDERTVVPIHHPTRTESYRIEHQYYDKHFPQTSQAQRDAGRLSSIANVQSQTVIQQQTMNLESDRGMER